jgi:hypothetical protein
MLPSLRVHAGSGGAVGAAATPASGPWPSGAAAASLKIGEVGAEEGAVLPAPLAPSSMMTKAAAPAAAHAVQPGSLVIVYESAQSMKAVTVDVSKDFTNKYGSFRMQVRIGDHTG